MALLRLCSGCGRSYDPFAEPHKSGLCPACTRTYEEGRRKPRVKKATA